MSQSATPAKLFTSCVSKYHACHVKRRWMSQSATPATQSASTCRQVPRLPRKQPRRPRRHVGTQRATRASPVPYVPRLPRMSPRTSCVMKLFTSCVSKYHACHVKRRWMSSSATPATQSNNPCHEVPRLPHKVKVDVTKLPRLPHKVKVDVTKCHACHTKCVCKLCVSKLHVCVCE